MARWSLVAALVHGLWRLAVSYGYLPWSNLLITIAIAYFLVITYDRLIYPFIDPLRKLPVAHISDLRVILTVTDAPRGETALRWAIEFQDHDMIRIRYNHNDTVMLLSPTALRDLLSTNEQDFVKPTGGRNFLVRILGSGLLLSEGLVHARQKKQLNTSFRVQNVRALHDLMLLKTGILLKNMEKQIHQAPEHGVDINDWASKVTLDIIGAALMSKDYDSLNKEHQPVNEAFGALTRASPGMTQLFMLNLVLPQWLVCALPTATNATVKKHVRTVRESCEASLAELKNQMKEGTHDGSDILTSIVADPDASHTEVIDQMITFLGAGHETTAASIAWVTHLLTLPENEHYQDRLREELRAHPDCTASPTAVEALPWLNAICEETLRIFPPVTNTARKAIRDTTIANTRIRRGQMIAVFPWAINRNPKYWGGKDAAKFIPERWLDERPDGTLHINNHGGAASNYCNLTFLQGNRSCIGKGFAKAELRLVVAKMFGDFRVARLPGDNGKVNPVGSVTIKPEGGLFVTLTRVD
ncbi:hypothetical protein PRZ48_002498 [Zasmidium cellare]|uniref:Cytochrome P450 n=1 Tax=Zasmidium cellare TaxID=395010 RepID=A0ABR0F470_ZASCE|nr:hypothetical protein PRZ48_002498 [Zasmidium cellare]